MNGPVFTLRNNVEGEWSDRALRQLVQMACPPEVPPFIVSFIYSPRNWRGRFVSPRSCWRGSGGRMVVQDLSPPYITVRMPRDETRRYPLEWKGCEPLGYLRFTTNTRDESLLALLAHELRHLWQWAQRSPNAKLTADDHRHEHNQDDINRETDADQYAIKVIERCRQEGPR